LAKVKPSRETSLARWAGSGIGYTEKVLIYRAEMEPDYHQRVGGYQINFTLYDQI
jgi:hypothetical protein